MRDFDALQRAFDAGVVRDQQLQGGIKALPTLAHYTASKHGVIGLTRALAFGTLNPMPIPWVETEDVSNVVLFFASDESRYITGTTLPVDAGASQK